MEQSLNWRVLSPNTLRAYTAAAKDFETVTGHEASEATDETIALWGSSMKARELSTNTIRQRLSAIAFIAGVRVDLPKRDALETPSCLLSADQVRKVLSGVADPDDRLLLVKLLTVGSQARTLTSRSNFEAHFLGVQIEMTTQSISRRIKRYARKAGLDEYQVNMRIWCQSGRLLVMTLKPNELVKLLDCHPVGPSGVQWKALHGIGRRSSQV